MKYILIIVTLLLSVSCNKKVYSGKIYLVGYESEWKSSEETYKFIKYQSTSKEYMRNVQYGTELIIEKNKVIGVNDYNYGHKGSQKTLQPFTYNFNNLEIERNIPYSILSAKKTKSFLGGIKPKELILPKYNEEIAFQYFGFISKDEFPNKILNFDLHLIAPIYDSFNELYLDYSNPLAPIIINEKESDFSRTFDEMNSFSKIVYKKTPIKFKKGGSQRYGFGYTGVPNWIQGPIYPKCPISGDDMIFLVAFDMNESKKQIKVENLNFKIERSNENYFKFLEFWITGSIYIFINPKTKIVCYLMQST